MISNQDIKRDFMNKTFISLINVCAASLLLCSCVDQQWESEKQLLTLDKENAKAYQFKQTSPLKYAVCGNAKFPCDESSIHLSDYNCRSVNQQNFYKTMGDIRLKTTNVQYLTCTRK